MRKRGWWSSDGCLERLMDQNRTETTQAGNRSFSVKQHETTQETPPSCLRKVKVVAQSERFPLLSREEAERQKPVSVT